MSITFPTFIDKEILSPEKLNAFVQDLESKFTSGIGTGDIQWPLLADGDLVMGTNSILGARKILNVVNAAQYSTLQLALTAASGGIMYIPSGTEIEADGATISNDITIIGAGESSVLRLSSGASSGYLLSCSVSGAKVRMYNLLLDGANEASNDGLRLSGVTDCVLSGVKFQDFGGDALSISDTGGVVASYIEVAGCKFDSGSGKHIVADNVYDLNIHDCKFLSADGIAVDLSAGGAGDYMDRISVVDNQFRGCATTAVRILGGSGTFGANWSDIVVADNVVDTGVMSSGDVFILGSSSGALRDISFTGNVAHGSFGDGAKVYAQYGVVSGNQLQGAGGDGIDLQSSEDLLVYGNNCRDFTTYGIDFVSTTDCKVVNNDCGGAGTLALNRPTGDAQDYGNGVLSAGHERGMFVIGTHTITGGSSGTGLTYTLPANTLKAGDILKFSIGLRNGGTAQNHGVALQINGQGCGQIGTGAYGTTGIDLVVDGVVAFDSATTAKAHAKLTRFLNDATCWTSADIADVTGLDLTADQTVGVYLSGGGGGGDSITAYHVIVEVIRGRDYS